MPEDTKVVLQSRKVELEKEFEALSGQEKELVEKNKTNNQELSRIVARQAELRGAYAEVTMLLGEKPVDPKVEVPPKVQKVTPKKSE